MKRQTYILHNKCTSARDESRHMLAAHRRSDWSLLRQSEKSRRRDHLHSPVISGVEIIEESLCFLPPLSPPTFIRIIAVEVHFFIPPRFCDINLLVRTRAQVSSCAFELTIEWQLTAAANASLIAYKLGSSRGMKYARGEARKKTRSLLFRSFVLCIRGNVRVFTVNFVVSAQFFSTLFFEMRKSTVKTLIMIDES